MTTEFRQKLNGTAGTAVTSLTILNAPGPSAFTGQSLTNASWVANPDSAVGSKGESTVLKIGINAAAQQRLDYTPSSNDTKVSLSLAVYLSALPPSGSANNLQVMNLQALDAGTQRGGLAVNITSSGLLQMQQASTSSASTYPSTGITITAGKTYRINMWSNISTDNSSGSVGVAVYDVAAGTQVGSTYTATGLNLGGATSQFTAAYFGKADKANQAITLYVSDAAASYGVAQDFGATPSMSVPTPPTLSGFCNMSVRAGKRVQVYCRTKPTTSGNTEAGVSVTTVSAVDAVTGAAVTLDSTNQIAWNAPATTSYTVGGVTVSVETNRTREATVPYLKRPLVYTCRITGTDSGGQAASQTFTLTVYSHDIWHNGPNGLVPGIISLPVVRAIKAAFMRLTSGAAQFNSDASSVGTWSTDSTTGAAVYDPDTPGAPVTYSTDPTTGANIITQ